MSRLFVLGHPGMYGGAATELHHQIIVWRKMGVDVTIIPTANGFQNEPLKPAMESIGVEYTDAPMDFSRITPDDAIINFCSSEFLDSIEEIYKHTERTCFVNCMTWLFPKEKLAHEKGLISMSLYQRPQVRDDHKKQLEDLGSEADFLCFSPYFDGSQFEFLPRKNNKRFTIGRISRQDADKFSQNTWHIWEYIVAPVFKRGICLGFDQRSKTKTGQPPGWVEAHHDHSSFPVDQFYKTCDIIVQSTDTTENWPRIGFEAMYSGCPLIVNAKGGWNYLIEHGVSGFACETTQEFIYWGSRMAFERDFREQIAVQARERAESLSSLEVSSKSWEKVLNFLFA